MEQLGFKKSYHMVGRIGGLRKRREFLDGAKFSKGRIVGRVDGHIIYDSSA